MQLQGVELQDAQASVAFQLQSMKPQSTPGSNETHALEAIAISQMRASHIAISIQNVEKHIPCARFDVHTFD